MEQVGMGKSFNIKQAGEKHKETQDRADRLPPH